MLGRNQGFTALLFLPVLAGLAGESQKPAAPDVFMSGVPIPIEIELNPDQIALLKKSPRCETGARVRVGSHALSSVNVRLKGSRGSFRSIDDKASFTLDFRWSVPEFNVEGATKIHLNNSVEDPSYLRERLGTDLFHAAGIPAPRAGRALVKLNGRRLGLYVLKEGLSEAFVAGNFKAIGGCAFEPIDGGDVNAPMQRHQVGKVSSRDVVGRLADAAAEPDLRRRWALLHMALDVEQFVRFMAAEVMLCHWDGYSLRRNNYRVYHDPSQDRVVFIPWGMDQLFAGDSLPWKPEMAGMVARGIMETPEGRKLYEEEFRALFAAHFRAETFVGRARASLAELRPFVTRTEFKSITQATDSLCVKIAQRERNLSHQLTEPGPLVPVFLNGTTSLVEWRPSLGTAGRLEQSTNSAGGVLLRISADSTTSASWRSAVRLAQGDFEFRARAKVDGVKGLPFGKHQGASVRVFGTDYRSKTLTGTTDWAPLNVRFTVREPEATVELVCELRTTVGEAWFESLELVRVE